MRHDEARAVSGTHVWSGTSGRKYRYSVFMYGTEFGPGPANFIFARELEAGKFVALYIGQTADLSGPLSGVLVRECLRLRRVTHVHIHFSDQNEEFRRAECSDLIEQWKPRCNAMR
jgi:hypothetical protein